MTPEQIKKLRMLCHSLKPVVLIGQSGLTDAVLNEINSALDHHELIKIRVNGADKSMRQVVSAKILEALGATLIQEIGHVACIYRKRIT